MAKGGVRFRFNLRTLLLAMTAICVLLGWALADAIRRNRAESEARQVVSKLGGIIAERGWSVASQDRPGWLAATLGLQRQMRSLWLVKLSGARPSPADLQALSECGWIRSLDLSNTQIGDAELAIVAQSPRLIELLLANTAVTDQGLQILKRQHALAVLDVDGSKVSYDGLAQLDRSLGSTNFEEAAAIQRGPFPGIFMPAFPRFIHSAEPELDMGLHLQQTQPIESLLIQNPGAFDPACWQHIVHLKLRDISASFGRMPFPGFQNVAELTWLESISFDGGYLTDADLAALAKLPKLRVVEMTGSNELTNDAPLQLGDNHTIKRLELSSPHIGLDIVSRLKTLHALEELRLNVWQKGPDGKYDRLPAEVTAKAAAAMAEIKDLPSLRSLHLSGNVISDEVFLGLKDAKQLTKVSWDGRFVSPDAVIKLRAHLPNCGF